MDEKKNNAPQPIRTPPTRRGALMQWSRDVHTGKTRLRGIVSLARRMSWCWCFGLIFWSVVCVKTKTASCRIVEERGERSCFWDNRYFIEFTYSLIMIYPWPTFQVEWQVSPDENSAIAETQQTYQRLSKLSTTNNRPEQPPSSNRHNTKKEIKLSSKQ